MSLRELLGSFGLCLLVCLSCISCGKGDDVSAIRALIEQGVESAEAHDIGGVLEPATSNLKVMPGNLDRREAKAALWRAFKHYGTMQILHPRPSIDVNEGKAEAFAALPFLILKREQPYPELDKLSEDPMAWLREVGEHADLYRLKMELVKEGSQWLVAVATFQRFTGLGFEE
jgi:hypothetical protein